MVSDSLDVQQRPTEAGDFESRPPIFVLGIDRSGTSMVSELLFRWGAHAGAQDLLCAADEGNPQGYWEYQPMQAFFTELMNSAGVSIWDPELSQAMRRQVSDPELRRRAMELAAEMGAPDRPWFWKDSQLIFSLPFLREVFPSAVYLITLRNPYDSAVSYEKLRIPAPLQNKVRLIGYTLLRWQHLMVSICEELKSYPRKLLVSYEALVSSPREQCARICRFLDAAYGPADDSEVRAERMAQSINPNLWRNDSQVPFAERRNVSQAQRDLFLYLSSRLDGDVSDFDAARYPFPEWSREYCSNMSVMQWLLGSL